MQTTSSALAIPLQEQVKSEYQPVIQRLIASIDKIKSVKDLLKQESEDSIGSLEEINNDAYIFMLLEVMDYGVTQLSLLSDIAFSDSKNDDINEEELIGNINRFNEMVETQLNIDD